MVKLNFRITTQAWDEICLAHDAASGEDAKNEDIWEWLKKEYNFICSAVPDMVQEFTFLNDEDASFFLLKFAR